MRFDYTKVKNHPLRRYWQCVYLIEQLKDKKEKVLTFENYKTYYHIKFKSQK